MSIITYQKTKNIKTTFHNYLIQFSEKLDIMCENITCHVSKTTIIVKLIKIYIYIDRIKYCVSSDLIYGYSAQ